MKDLIKKIQDKIVDYVFEISDRPMSFMELLKTNKLYDDKMPLEGNIAGFKMNKKKAYLIFFILWNLVILPIVAIFHSIIAKLDCHVSIVLAIVFTLLFFASFSIFKEWLYEEVTLKQIKKNWSHHFPIFTYEKNHKLITQIYTEALEKEIPQHELRVFIFDKLSSL